MSTAFYSSLQPYKSTAAIAGGVVIGLAVLKKVYDVVCASKTAQAGVARRAAQKPEVVYLFMAPRIEGFLNISSPSIKVETFLRIHKIPYVVTYTRDNSMSPTERLPFAELNGKAFADSNNMIEIIAAHFKVSTPANTPEKLGISTAVMRLCDESLRLHFLRYHLVDNFSNILPIYAKVFGAPQFLVRILLRSYRKKMVTMLNLHGYGDLYEPEVAIMWQKELEALEGLLSKQTYLLSDTQMCHADFCIFAWLYVIQFDVKYKASLKPCAAIDFLERSSVLQSYIQRIQAAAFPDHDALVTGAALRTGSQSFLTY